MPRAFHLFQLFNFTRSSKSLSPYVVLTFLFRQMFIWQIWSFTMKSSFCKHAIVTQTDPKESSSLSTTCGVASPSSSPRRRYPAPNTAMFFPVPRRLCSAALCLSSHFFPVVWSLHRHCFTDQIESKVIIFLVFSSQVLMFVYVKQFTDEKQRILYATLWHLPNLSYPSNCHFSLNPCHLTVSSHIRFVSPLVLVWTNNLCIQILNGPFV